MGGREDAVISPTDDSDGDLNFDDETLQEHLRNRSSN